MSPPTPTPTPSHWRRRGRPAKQAAGLEPETRRLLLRAGLAALTEKGYSAVGVDEILRASGVPKGSFYHWFGSKEAFGQALIAAYASYFARKLDHWLLPKRLPHTGSDLAPQLGPDVRPEVRPELRPELRPGVLQQALPDAAAAAAPAQQAELPPLQRLRLFVADARAGMARHQFRRGCLVGNLGQEMGALPESFRLQLQQVFADWQARTAACLREAQAQGALPAQADADALAEFFWIGWEGAVLRAKLAHSAAPLDLYADGFFALLGTGSVLARGPAPVHAPAANPAQP